MSGRLGPSGLRARHQRNMTKRNKAGRWWDQGTLVERQKRKLVERIEDMAKRMSRTERHKAHQRKVEGHKQRLREEMQDGGHIYGKEWLREAIRSGDSAYAEAIEEMLGEIGRHNREHPPDFPRRGVDDHMDRMRDLESRRREARDLERVAGIAESARKKAAGIGGGLFATAAPEPEPEEDEGPDPAQEEYEQQRRALMGHGLLSRTPAPPQQPRKKKRRGYVPPPFVG